MITVRLKLNGSLRYLKTMGKVATIDTGSSVLTVTRETYGKQK